MLSQMVFYDLTAVFRLEIWQFAQKSVLLSSDFAPVAKLVYAPDLGSGVSRRAGSSPVRRTNHKKRPKKGDKYATNLQKRQKIEFFYKKN